MCSSSNLSGGDLLYVRIQRNDPTITQVKLPEANDYEIDRLAIALKSNTHVQTLRILSLRLSPKGYAALSVLVEQRRQALVLEILDSCWLMTKTMFSSPPSGTCSGMLKRRSSDFFQRILSIDSNLKELSIYRSFIDQDMFESLTKALQRNTNLSTLSLSYAGIAAPYLPHLLDAMTVNCSLQHLDLRGSSLAFEDGEQQEMMVVESSWHQSFCHFLMKHAKARKVHQLALIGEKTRWITGQLALGKLIQKSKCLVSLNLSSCNLDQHVMAPVVKALQRSDATLRRLDLESNACLGKEGFQRLALMLDLNKSLAHLNLASTSVFQEGMIDVLAGALLHNETLQCLDLSCNVVGSEDNLKSLITALHGNTSLLELIMDRTFLGSQGACGLLKAGQKLQTLRLAENHLDDTDIQALSRVLGDHTSLQVLDLHGNRTGDKGAKALAKALTTNATLNQLDVSKNSIGDQGLSCLFNALESNSTLAELDVRSNPVTPDTLAVSLAQCVPHLQGLERLYHSVAMHQCRPTSLSELACVLSERNTVLQHFDLISSSDGDTKSNTTNLYLSQIGYYLDEKHRRVVQDRAQPTGRLSLALWPFILQNVGQQFKTGCIFQYLRADPGHLFSGLSRTTL